VEARIVDADTQEPQPWDDSATGELQVRGPWCAQDYYNPDAGVQLTTEDGWMRTGDVAAMDEFGNIRIADRTKDLIKSGGEWISSVDLENAIMSHPKVKEAAVVGIPHPKWDERPLACVVLKDGRRGGDPRAHPPAGGQVVAARRGRVHRRGAQDQRGQVQQEGPAHPLRGVLPEVLSVSGRRAAGRSR
jgi:acyl-CoA synthetase (AMP-forming)/AMP-acid ligase II